MKKVGYRIKFNAICFRERQSGGSFAVVFIGLGSIFLALLVLVNIADYSILTYKRNTISKAMDYAVNAAVQEIDINQSKEGLSNGFSEVTGCNHLEGVKINTDKAQKTFITAFYENYNTSNFSVYGNLLLCATHAEGQKLSYEIKTDNGQITKGSVACPELMENTINQAIRDYSAYADKASLIYINGNEKTNMIENGTYLFAFIKDIKIKGLYSQRTTCLLSFAGAKVDRWIEK